MPFARQNSNWPPLISLAREFLVTPVSISPPSHSTLYTLLWPAESCVHASADKLIRCTTRHDNKAKATFSFVNIYLPRKSVRLLPALSHSRSLSLSLPPVSQHRTECQRSPTPVTLLLISMHSFLAAAAHGRPPRLHSRVRCAPLLFFSPAEPRVPAPLNGVAAVAPLLLPR